MKTVCFTGHRPKQLFGTYDTNNPKASLLVEELTKTIERLIVDEKADTFISGGALGADQLAFICVNALKKKFPFIKNILASPYLDQPMGWEEQLKKAQANGWKKAVEDLQTTLRRYNRILELADDIIYVDELTEYQPRGMQPDQVGRHSNVKLQLRNVYMVDQSDIVVAIFDGTKGGTFNCIKTAKEKGKRIIVLDPKNGFRLVKS